MPDYDLSQVECLLYDPEINVRRLLRDALGLLKVSQVEMLGSVEELRKALQHGTLPDLLIADGAAEDGELLKLVARLRQGAFGGNPFMGVIVTAFNPTQALLAKVTNCGADALLAKPVAPRQIRDRILGLVESSRGFVVTADYVGPDRRRGPRDTPSANLVEVPNTMRLKATGTAAKVSARDLIDAAVAEVADRRLVRQVFQVAFLAEFAREVLDTNAGDRVAFDHLARIPPILEEVVRRLPAAEDGSRPHAVDVARGIVVEVERARHLAQTPGSTVSLKGLLANAFDLMAEISPGRDRPEMEREVTDAAAAYRARLEEILQAKAAEAAADPTPTEPTPA